VITEFTFSSVLKDMTPLLVCLNIVGVDITQCRFKPYEGFVSYYIVYTMISHKDRGLC
jgi:hypothetical protein